MITGERLVTQQISPTNSQPQIVRIGSTIYRCSTPIHGIFTVRDGLSAKLSVRSGFRAGGMGRNSAHRPARDLGDLRLGVSVARVAPVAIPPAFDQPRTGIELGGGNRASGPGLPGPGPGLPEPASAAPAAEGHTRATGSWSSVTHLLVSTSQTKVTSRLGPAVR